MPRKLVAIFCKFPQFFCRGALFRWLWRRVVDTGLVASFSTHCSRFIRTSAVLQSTWRCSSPVDNGQTRLNYDKNSKHTRMLNGEISLTIMKAKRPRPARLDIAWSTDLGEVSSGHPHVDEMFQLVLRARFTETHQTVLRHRKITTNFQHRQHASSVAIAEWRIGKYGHIIPCRYSQNWPNHEIKCLQISSK